MRGAGWNMITFVKSGSTVTLYVNAVQEVTGTQTNSLTSLALYIMARNQSDNGNSPTGFFDGTIDEMGWWNKALSSSEITDLYGGGSGLPYS